jgi:hypothetical protein
MLLLPGHHVGRGRGEGDAILRVEVHSINSVLVVSRLYLREQCAGGKRE